MRLVKHSHVLIGRRELVELGLANVVVRPLVPVATPDDRTLTALVAGNSGVEGQHLVSVLCILGFFSGDSFFSNLNFWWSWRRHVLATECNPSEPPEPMRLVDMPCDELLAVMAFVPSTDWLCVALTCSTLCRIGNEHAKLYRTPGKPHWVASIITSLSRMEWAIQMLPAPYFVWHCPTSEDKLPNWFDKNDEWDVYCESGDDLRQVAFQVAARDGHLALLLWLYPFMPESPANNKMKTNIRLKAACDAAGNAQLSVLKWFHSKKVRMRQNRMWEPEPFDYAIASGDLPTVQFLYTINDYDGDSFTFTDPMEGGVPWYLQAKQHGHIDILRWMVSVSPSLSSW